MKPLNKKIYLHLFILVSLLMSLPSQAADVVWFNGRNAVTYTVKNKKSQILETALQMFEHDMQLVTGRKAQHDEDGTIVIYELDKLKDKEFRKLSKTQIPLQSFIAKTNAFYLGTQGNKIVIVGSDALGTAYGVLELSKMAGVSPWAWWADVTPSHKNFLSLRDGYHTVQWPSVQKRAIVVTDSRHNHRQLQQLLLRLHGNTLTQTDGEGTRTLTLSERWVPSTQPGYIFNEMRNAYRGGAVKAWNIVVSNPKVSAYQLQLFMDMAWNMDYVNEHNLQEHYLRWLSTLFDDPIAQRLLPVMTEYYHLTGIRKPEQMDVEFAADAFGNELERYIDQYQRLCAEVEKVKKLVPKDRQDAYFGAIEFPVKGAALMAEKQLQAQEARHIGRPEAFHHDEEALASAVRSWQAYESLNALNAFYDNQYADGKWHGTLDFSSNKLISGAPELPGKLTKDELKKYAKAEKVPFSFDTESTITRNACNYRKASPGCVGIEMLGHSMKAVAMPKGGRLSYSFYSEIKGDAILRIAAIPTQGTDSRDVLFSVSIDGGKPIIFSSKSPDNKAQWEQDIKRGQALREIPVSLSHNSHSIDIQALDDGVVIDQIMIDYDTPRHFYMFPAPSELN